MPLSRNHCGRADVAHQNTHAHTPRWFVDDASSEEDEEVYVVDDGKWREAEKDEKAHVIA
jgi:hypothetical protein